MGEFRKSCLETFSVSSLCQRSVRSRSWRRCVSNGQGLQYICRAVASVYVRHGYAPKPFSVRVFDGNTTKLPNVS